MTAAWIAAGILLLAIGGGLFYVGLPRNGQLNAVSRNALVGEFYVLAIVVSVTFGIAFLIKGWLT